MWHARVAVCAKRHCTTDHWHATPWSYHAGTTRTSLAGHPRACQLSSSKRHAWLASRCPGRSLSTWQTTAASCPTALGALCGQLTFRLAWCREHSAVTATELLRPLDLACETHFRSSCAIQTSTTDCSDDKWRDMFLRKARTRQSVIYDMLAVAPQKKTYLLIYLRTATLLSRFSFCAKENSTLREYAIKWWLLLSHLS